MDTAQSTTAKQFVTLDHDERKAILLAAEQRVAEATNQLALLHLAEASALASVFPGGHTFHVTVDHETSALRLRGLYSKDGVEVEMYDDPDNKQRIERIRNSLQNMYDLDEGAGLWEPRDAGMFESQADCDLLAVDLVTACGAE